MLIAQGLLGEGGTLLVLGLSRENMDRLESGQPIDLSRDTHGLAVPAGLKIMIFAGETEASMHKMLGTLIGPETVVDQKRPL
jgi:hypothetical protein